MGVLAIRHPVAAKHRTDVLPWVAYVVVLAIVFGSRWAWIVPSISIVGSVPTTSFNMRPHGVAVKFGRVTKSQTARRFTANPKQLKTELAQATSAQPVLDIL